MSEAVLELLDQFEKLSPRDRAEFLAASLKPREEYGEWEEVDAALVAAETFALLDTEEEEQNNASE